MSVLHSPRAPWILLLLFGAAVLVLVLLAAGRDVGLLRDADTLSDPSALTREVRMPIPQVPPSSARGQAPASPAKERPIPDRPQDPPAPPPVAAPRDVPPPAVPEPTAGPGRLLAYTITHHDEDTGLTARFRTDIPVADPRVFFLADPALWVVDLPGRWTNLAPRVHTSDQGVVGRMVIGEHPDHLRIVFHYRDRDRPRPAAAPVVTRQSQGITVSIAP
ncbi:AMIN domain-containing protein [Desulfatitalea alkaliphila]|uniref:AMIN domain-containing protein n=1 Tax=Desulfatitalea alkaliphila TaxID=2929485 RepID=A0AA41UKL7_9BACT|nr:AMIN domain-containing protein [Desulfatitalea alkaliphila]MCJ8502439.1 AMIN domain-containing protein [Desulfatitalea alkaliphila]